MEPSFHLYGIRITLSGDLEAARDRVHLAHKLRHKTQLVNANDLEIVKNHWRFDDGTRVDYLHQHGFDSAHIYVPPIPPPKPEPPKKGYWIERIWPAHDCFNDDTLDTHGDNEYEEKFMGIALCKGGGFNPIYEYIPREKFPYGIIPDDQYAPTHHWIGLISEEDIMKLYRPYEFEEDPEKKEREFFAVTNTVEVSMAQLKIFEQSGSILEASTESDEKISESGTSDTTVKKDHIETGYLSATVWAKKVQKEKATTDWQTPVVGHIKKSVFELDYWGIKEVRTFTGDTATADANNWVAEQNNDLSDAWDASPYDEDTYDYLSSTTVSGATHKISTYMYGMDDTSNYVFIYSRYDSYTSYHETTGGVVTNDSSVEYQPARIFLNGKDEALPGLNNPTDIRRVAEPRFFKLGETTYILWPFQDGPSEEGNNYRYLFIKDNSKGDRKYIYTTDIKYSGSGEQGTSGIIPEVEDEDGNPLYHNHRTRLVRERKYIKG